MSQHTDGGQATGQCGAVGMYVNAVGQAAYNGGLRQPFGQLLYDVPAEVLAVFADMTCATMLIMGCAFRLAVPL